MGIIVLESRQARLGLKTVLNLDLSWTLICDFYKIKNLFLIDQHISYIR